MWGDEKFRRLSPIQPCGQGLFIYLLTSPLTTNIPGLFRANETGLAADLGWSLKAFREAFLEGYREGLILADWKAHLVWVKNAIKYNRPQSPNVIKSWLTTWDEIPECELKVTAYQHIKDFVIGLDKGFQEAFEEALGKPLVKTMPIQEQEQEQDQDLPLKPPRGGLAFSDFRQFYEAYPLHKERERAERAFRAAVKRGATLDEMLAAISRQVAERKALQAASQFSPEWKHPATWLNAGCWMDEPKATVDLNHTVACRRCNRPLFWSPGSQPPDYCQTCREVEEANREAEGS